MKNWIVFLTLLSSTAFASVPAVAPPVKSTNSHFPIWKIERNLQTSYIIGTPPFDVELSALPTVYGRLIRSKPKFCTDIGENSHEISFVQDLLNTGAQDGYGYETLSSDQRKFIRGIFRRWILTRKPRWMQIFIPGYAGIFAEGAAFASGVVPPAIVANAIISAATGIGLGPGPSDEDALLKTAKSEHRDVVTLPDGVDYQFFVQAIDVGQLKDLVDYVQLEMKYGHTVDLVTAYEKLFDSAGAKTMFDLGERLHRSLDTTIEKIIDAHSSGGAVISINLMRLADSSARKDFFKHLESRGFKITPLNMNESAGISQSCSRLLIK